jgi:NAD-dependent dihydropyrimidine dehydrogenase PreA subunit
MKYLANVASLGMFQKNVRLRYVLEVCPHNVFAIQNKKAVIIDKDGCMECGACADNCAFGALSVDKGVGCAAAIINSIITGGEPSCGCDNDTKTSGCC